MTHVRTQIRDKFAERLAGLATTGNNVFKRRMFPFKSGNTPGLNIHVGDEEISTFGEEEGIETGTQQRELEVFVDAVDMDNSGLEDTLDQIAAEVEASVFTDPFFDNLVRGCELTGITTLGSEELEEDAGALSLRFNVIYVTAEGNPEVANP